MSRKQEAAARESYADIHPYLMDELACLDLRLRIRVAAQRQRWQQRPDAGNQHLFVADDEIDSLLEPSPRVAAASASSTELVRLLREREREIAGRAAETLRRGRLLPMLQLERLFGLSRFEQQAIVVCLAPELRRHYDRVYAYLQDDITRKRPSIDLILDVLCDTETQKWRARAMLAATATLRRVGILEAVDDPHSPSGASSLAQFLRLDSRILDFLLGQDTVDVRLSNIARLQETGNAGRELAVDQEAKQVLLSFAARWSSRSPSGRERLVISLHGPRGAGKRELALAMCAELRCPMLLLDATRLPRHVDDAEPLLRLAFRESLLFQAPLYIAPSTVFLADGEPAASLRSALTRTAASYGWMTFVAGDEPWPEYASFGTLVFYQAAVRLPVADVREQAWRQTLPAILPDAPVDAVAPPLAQRFSLTAGQIRQVAQTLAHRRVVHGSTHPVTFDEIAAICRGQSHHGLAALGSKIEPRQDWADLILPPDKVAQLRELCSQVRHQHVVYEHWGFGRKLARGRGISALFSGPPGTGKTMAAEVIAGELRLDLYKIDLARVVSKYIGETEKNLARIFSEAEQSNAILFFDEADAIFGKRTEITDAHDRYANVETSYLLQRMEEYAGIVILASNLAENMDTAFLRRVRFLIEFPFPDAANRLRIWKAHFPAPAPLGDVDYEHLARSIQVAGGNIKNIVLMAAFLAAANGGRIGMEHLLQGARYEFEKIGKLWDDVTPVGKRS